MSLKSASMGVPATGVGFLTRSVPGAYAARAHHLALRAPLAHPPKRGGPETHPA